MNTEQVVHNNMLREIEVFSYGGDVQDDAEQWLDVKRQLPPTSHMVWVACPNSYLCGYQTFLFYVDSDGEWRDQFGVLMFRKVSFWRDIVFGVPVYDGVC